MFFPVTSKDGKKASINLTLIFAFVDMGTYTIAVSSGSTTFEIPVKHDELMQEIEEYLAGEDE